MSRRTRRTAAAQKLGALLATLAVAGCDAGAAIDKAATPVTPAWRADCAAIERPAPLSMEEARLEHRRSERRHEIRLREAASPGYLLRTLHDELDAHRLQAGELCPQDVAEVGRILFEHEFGYADGLGGGDGATRPRGPFRRVHEGLFGGPETISCTSCHWVGGPNGAGAETDNAMLSGDGDGMASGDGRNPQALLGLGVVQALAREMTRELQAQRDALLGDAAGGRREARLTSKGVDFGVLRMDGSGNVDASGVDGIDADLVVRPFGWKGTLARFEDFAAEAMQVHIGMQTELLLAGGDAAILGDGDPADRDGDGNRREMGGGPFAALGMHLALLELPVVRPLIQDRRIAPAATGLLPPTTTSFAEDFQRGRRVFHDTGCASCHTPMMVLRDPVLEIEGLPPVDLARNMRAGELRFDAALGGYPVWLFSDLKRHDMGAANEAQHVQRGVTAREYLTPRLWGVADSAPYLHDGRAPSFDYAIAGHDGDGGAAAAKFNDLSFENKGALRVYLMSLRRESRLTVLQ